MRVRTQELLATAGTLAATALIAAVIWNIYREVNEADRQRQQTTEIAQRLSELRLLMFEYVVDRPERARIQWIGVSSRLDRLLTNTQASDSKQAELLQNIKDRTTQASGLFGELSSAPAAQPVSAASDQLDRRHDAQVLNRLMIQQQDNFTDAYRLNALSGQFIGRAQDRLMIVTLAGLLLIAMLKISVSWLMNRHVLAPIGRLQRVAKQIAGGNWNATARISTNDEIGDLSKNFDAMTHSLRASFAQIERSNQELGALNQELEAFSYSVSHDLRGPLRSMDGFSQALLEDYGDKLDAEGKDSLERIRAASQSMGGLIDDLLRLSRVTRVELNVARIDLTAMAREVAASLDREQQERPVEWVIEEGMSIEADKALMQVVMQNLMQNARKFTGKKDKALVRVGARECDGKIAHFVADNGAGFDMAHAGRLFGAFQRLHHESEFPGTGIGLAIVQRIIRRHGGRIWAESAEGAGATFLFVLKTEEA